MTTRGGRLVAVAGVVFVAVLATTECSKPGQKPAPAARTPPPLSSEMTPVVSVKELMANMIDPVSDNIFDAVWWEVTPKGIIDHQPKTDEDWEKVKTGAVSLAEGIFLLKIRRELTPQGDVNNSTGPNPPELSPAQIRAKIDKDPVLWDAKIQALRNVGLEVLEVVKKKDAKALFDASADLDEACEACHLEYWYPGDKKAVDEYKHGRVTYDKVESKK